MQDFFERHRKKIMIWAAVFTVVYLVIHFALERDQLAKLKSIGDFIGEGKEHIIHVAPVVIVFIVFGILEIKNRLKKRREQKIARVQSPPETP